MKAVAVGADPTRGRIVWSPVKSLWFTGHAAVAVIGGVATFSVPAALVAFGTTVVTVCAGTVGFHRLLIHRSFSCPKWLEYALVWPGVASGMGGPLAAIRVHDLRDWAQRNPECHAYFSDTGPAWRDALWQLHCDLRLDRPPVVSIEREVAEDPVYRSLQRFWMLVQVPISVWLYLFGGWAFVIWGVSVRIAFSLVCQWAVAWLAHNRGAMPRRMEGYAVQGRNVPGLGLVSMGEAHHNNHHACPKSARFGEGAGQPDPGWWLIRLLAALGLASDIRLPGGVVARRPYPRRTARRALLFREP